MVDEKERHDGECEWACEACGCDSRTALRALAAQLAEALKQHEGDECTCGPDPGAPSCVACYDRAVLATYRASGIGGKE